MRFKGVSVFLMLVAALTFVSCGGDDNGGGGSADDLQSVAEGNMEPGGELTDPSQLTAAVEGLFNQAGVTALMEGTLANSPRYSTRAQGDGSECVSGDENSGTIDFDCLDTYMGGEGAYSGSVSYSFEGDEENPPWYIEINYTDVVMGDYEADGTVAFWTDGTLSAAYVDMTFNGEAVGPVWVVVNGEDVEAIWIQVEGDWFQISNIDCKTVAGTCSFTVTDGTGDTDCSVSQETAEVTCDGL